MEITLSPELMELLRELLNTFVRLQYSYLIYVAIALMPILFIVLYNTKSLNALKRIRLIKRLEKTRKSAVITLIHQSMPTGILDLLKFKMPMINLDDSQKLLKALRETPPTMPIDLVLHTPGGMVIAAEQLARIIKNSGRKVRAHIPQYAMSGGTLVALACTEIHMGKNAILGPLDPQLSIGLFDMYPAASILKAAKAPNAHRDDKTLILADIAQKAVVQMKGTVTEILCGKVNPKKTKALAEKLCTGNWTHDYGINKAKALALGIPIDDDSPKEFLEIVETYPNVSAIQHRKKKTKEQDTGLITIHL